MTSVKDYRTTLRNLGEWEPYLLENSGLPGPRGNLELADAVADAGSEEQFRRWLTLEPEQAPVNSREEFLAFCGVVGLGRLLAEGRSNLLPIVRSFTGDPRWRMREGVARALQRWGDADMQGLLRAMMEWSQGNPWEQRAAAAALCEPRLLSKNEDALAVLRILDDITASLERSQDRGGEAFKVLRQGLGYCWSVAVAAYPEEGKRLMEKWFANPDPDIRWIVRENLRKNRLARMDPQWTQEWRARLH